MTSHEILRSDLLDIIFDNRNKKYGAYELRRSYNFRMGLALAITLSIFFLTFLFINPSGSSSDTFHINNDPGLVVTEVEEMPRQNIPPLIPDQRRTPAQPLNAQREFVSAITIVDDNSMINDIATQSDLRNAAISNLNTEGKPSDVGIQPPNITNGNGNSVVATDDPQKILPTKSPEFPGGVKAWLAFLNKHLNSPVDLEPGEKKTVMVRFTVGVDGSITNYEVMQSGGSAFDNEVIRVMKKMPKWSPAIQNGVNIAISFTQPVTFIGLEE